MSIAILLYSLSGGGAERMASYLVKYLVGKNYDVHLFLMNDKITYEIPENLSIHFLEKSNPDESGILKLLKIPKIAISYAIKCKSLGITHSLSLMTRPNFINVISSLFYRRSKIILNERAFPSLQYGYGDLQSKINKKLIKLLFPLADMVICNSQGNFDDLKNNFSVSPYKLRLVNNPIDLEKISGIKPIDGFFDKSYLNLITVGRLDPGKNHKMLFNAIENMPMVRLYILGEGPLGNELKELVEQKKLQDKVFFLGFTKNPFEYVKSADLFIFGSNHEGFPNVLLEAMACGTPIISTNCKSGPSEIMKVDKEESDQIMTSKYGYLVPINNSELMRAAINKFIESPELLQTMKKDLAERINDFELAKILNQFKEIISQN